MPARRPTLDYRPAGEAEHAAIEPLLEAGWLTQDLEKLAETYALQHLVPHMLEDVRTRRLVHVDKVEREVESRLKRAIMHWDRRAEDLKVQEQGGQEDPAPVGRRCPPGRSRPV